LVRKFNFARAFEAILVTAAPDHVLPALVLQLRADGTKSLLVGTSQQELLVLTRNANGTTSI
jgi:protein-L-isoaspartate(D-aspartate) O-methyltransferase